MVYIVLFLCLVGIVYLFVTYWQIALIALFVLIHVAIVYIYIKKSVIPARKCIVPFRVQKKVIKSRFSVDKRLSLGSSELVKFLEFKILENFYSTEIAKLNSSIKICKDGFCFDKAKRAKALISDYTKEKSNLIQAHKHTTEDLKNVLSNIDSSYYSELISLFAFKVCFDDKGRKYSNIRNEINKNFEKDCISYCEIGRDFIVLTPLYCVVYDYDDDTLNVLPLSAIEDCVVPSEEMVQNLNREHELIRKCWKYHRLDGGPDLRYSYNPVSYLVRIYKGKIKFGNYAYNFSSFDKKIYEALKESINKFNTYVEFVDFAKIWCIENITALSEKDFEQFKVDKNFLSNCLIDKDVLYSLKNNVNLNNCKIHIPNNVKTIYSGVFKGSNVKEIVLNSKIREINNFGFSECSKLEVLDMPLSIKTIGEYFLCNCKSLKLIKNYFDGEYFEINSNLTKIDDDAFCSCPIEKIRFGTKVNSEIYKCKFNDIKEIDLPDNISFDDFLNFISVDARWHQKITFYSTNKKCNSKGCFSNDKMYAKGKMTIPKCVNRLEGRLINSHCIDEFIINEWVEYIDPHFFDKFFGRKIRIKGTPHVLSPTTMINNEIIYDTNEEQFDDTFVIDKDSLSKVNGIVFTKTTNLKINCLDKEVTDILANFVNVVDIDVLVDVEKVPDECFANHKQLVNVTLSDSVKIIGKKAFMGCDKLQTITANNLEIIEESAFQNCYKLKSPNFLANVKKIEASAFLSCKAICKVELNNSISVIPESCFGDCYSLLSVYANQISEIGDKAFKGCTKLKNINFEITGLIGDEAFFHSGLVKLNMSNNNVKFGLRCFESCNKLKTIELPENLESLNDGMFKNCTSLTKITLPKKLERIGKECFLDCTSLSNFDDLIVKNVDDFAFKNTGIESISFLKEVSNFGVGCFSECSKLEKVLVPYGLEKISKNCFENCLNLKTVSIPDSVTLIEDEAFKGCLSILAIVGMAEIKEINYCAFEGCAMLTKLVFPQSLEIFDRPIQNCENLQELIFTNDMLLLNIDFTGVKSLNKIVCPLHIERAIFGGYGSSMILTHVYNIVTLRGAEWVNRSDYHLKIEYQNKQEYLKARNDYLFEAGYPLDMEIINPIKIKSTQKTTNFKPLKEENIIRNQNFNAPVKPQRATWNTTIVKNETKDNNVEVKQVDIPTYEISNIDDFAVENVSTNTLNEDLIIFDGNLVNAIEKITYLSQSEQSFYAFIINGSGELISSVIKATKVASDQKVSFNLSINDDASNGNAFIVIFDESYSVISCKKTYLDRMYNANDLFDF